MLQIVILCCVLSSALGTFNFQPSHRVLQTQDQFINSGTQVVQSAARVLNAPGTQSVQHFGGELRQQSPISLQAQRLPDRVTSSVVYNKPIMGPTQTIQLPAMHGQTQVVGGGAGANFNFRQNALRMSSGFPGVRSSYFSAQHPSVYRSHSTTVLPTRYSSATSVWPTRYTGMSTVLPGSMSADMFRQYSGSVMPGRSFRYSAFSSPGVSFATPAVGLRGYSFDFNQPRQFSYNFNQNIPTNIAGTTFSSPGVMPFRAMNSAQYGVNFNQQSVPQPPMRFAGIGTTNFDQNFINAPGLVQGATSGIVPTSNAAALNVAGITSQFSGTQFAGTSGTQFAGTSGGANFDLNALSSKAAQLVGSQPALLPGGF